MKRMKTFLIYLLLVLAVVLSTDIVSKLVLETNYKDLTKYEILATPPEINITESKAGRANGRVKGTITNKTENALENIYIKLELKSKNNITLGSEFAKVESLKPNESKEFLINFRYSDVESFIISTTSQKEQVPSIEEDPLYKNVVGYLPIAKLVVWCITPAIYFLPLFLFTGK